MKLKYAPVEISLKLKEKLRPGEYSVKFLLVYFNGSEWKVSTERATFAVRSFFQRNEWLTWCIALLGGILALLPGLQILFNYFR